MFFHKSFSKINSSRCKILHATTNCLNFALVYVYYSNDLALLSDTVKPLVIYHSDSKKWNERRLLTVKDLMEEMIVWQKERYLDPEIWDHLISRINPALWPAPSVLQEQILFDWVDRTYLWKALI